MTFAHPLTLLTRAVTVPCVGRAIEALTWHTLSVWATKEPVALGLIGVSVRKLTPAAHGFVLFRREAIVVGIAGLARVNLHPDSEGLAKAGVGLSIAHLRSCHEGVQARVTMLAEGPVWQCEQLVHIREGGEVGKCGKVGKGIPAGKLGQAVYVILVQGAL